VTLEDFEDYEDDAGDVDDCHHEERGVAEERVGGGHTVVQDKDRGLGRQYSGVVDDGKGVDEPFEGVLPLGQYLFGLAG
jgi:hypothetical protein